MYLFPFNGRKILEQALKYEYNGSDRTAWRLNDACLVPAVRSVLPVINNFKRLCLPENFQLLKGKAGDSIVLRVKMSCPVQRSFILKLHPAPPLKDWLKFSFTKHPLFDRSEAANLIIAAKRGLNVPKLYGCGHLCNSFGLPKLSVIILEDLSDYTPVGALLKSNETNEKKKAEILKRTIPVFVGLYHANCNNIEINTHAIMLSNNGSKRGAVVLDFEYAGFAKKPSFEVLMFEAACLVKHSPQLLTETIIDNWLSELLDAVNVSDPGVRCKLKERFNYYRAAKLHRRARRQIR